MEEKPPSGPQLDVAQAMEIDLALRPDHFLLGFEDDVTKLTLFVPSESPPPVGETRLVRVALPSGGVVEALGEVKLHRPPTGGHAAGYVLGFLELDVAAKEALQTFVRASTHTPEPQRPSGPPASRRSTDRMRAVLDVQIADDVDVEADVTMESENHFFNGFSENISDGGLFVQSWAHKKVGDHLTLRITLPDDDEPIETIGEVRWVRSYDRTHDTAPGFGISFLDLEERDKKRIDNFLKQRKPLFYDD
ncbi:MAG: TIGR02266 family protein [Polyangiales bacterium]